MKYFGDRYDIHTSSRELMFPHHENRIAIAAAITGKNPARYWVHCDRVMVDGKKVDANGAGFTLQNLMDMGYSGREIRYWLLTGHYRKPVTFSVDRLEDARRSLDRLDACIRSLLTVQGQGVYADLNQLLYDIKHGFTDAMDDDLNISAAMASVFKNIKKINILILERKIGADDALKIVIEFKSINTVLHVFTFEEPMTDKEIENLVRAREDARKDKNWVLSDQIRDQLTARGVRVRDGKS